MNAKISRNSRGKTRAMEFHLYSMDFFLSFTRIFLYTFRNFPYNFLLWCVRISKIMNVKKSRNSRGKTRAMESHFFTIDFFFLSRQFSYEHSEGRQCTTCKKRTEHVKSVLGLFGSVLEIITSPRK